MQLEDSNDKLMLYGMLLTHFYHYVMKTYPYLQSTQYQPSCHVMDLISKSYKSSFLEFERLPTDDILDEELLIYQERRIEGD
jgi:hypothetical protein